VVEVPSDVEIYEEDQGRKSAGAVVGGCFGGWDSTDFGGKVMIASRFDLIVGRTVTFTGLSHCHLRDYD